MKLLASFCVVAVWLQMPVEGKALKFGSLDFQQFNNKRSTFISSEESGEDSSDSSFELNDISASDAVKAGIREFVRGDVWRSLIVAFASDETMADPTFRTKWNIPDDYEKEKTEQSSDEDYDKVLEFINSNEWKALLSLSSTKEELMSPTYREQWGLDFSVDISDADENGNFFEGPQWKVFVELTEYDDDEDRDDWEKVSFLLLWMLKIGEDLEALD